MDRESKALETVCNVNGTSRTDVTRESSSTANHTLIGRETTTPVKPNAANPVHKMSRRRPGRPKKIRHRDRSKQPWGTAGCPAPTNYFAVLRPERTYERRPTICPILRQETLKRLPEPPEDPNGRAAKEAAALRLQPNILSPAHMLAPVIDFPGLRVPPKPPAAEVSSTTGLLCSQLDKLQKEAKSGNEGALLLLEQYKAFGKQRHHFSERMLLKCSLWRARSCYSYHCARRTQLFTLPGRTTLHRYGQLGSSS